MKIKIISLFTILCIFSISLLFYLYYEEKLFTTNEGIFHGKLNNKRYHFAVISQNTDDPFWQEVKKGCLTASKKYKADIEFNGPRFTNMEEELKYLDVAIASKVDGIATHVFDEDKFSPLIGKAISQGIPVVTIESDTKKGEKHCFIGTSNYQMGQESGKFVKQTVKGKADVVMISNNWDRGSRSIDQNLWVTGFKSNFKNDDLNLRIINNSKSGAFLAGEIAKKAINNYPHLKAIVCTNSKDTIEVAQMVIDLNKVGDVTIIGFGKLPEILRYIENRVIYGTVVSNPEKIGYESIKALYDLKNRKIVSSYIDTGIYSITNSNISKYEKKKQNRVR